jgi:hypothetical protein
MPFISVNDNGESLLIFAVIINGAWKHHYCLNDGVVKRLHTGIGDEINECSPTALYKDGEWHISFVAGGHINSQRLRLYTMKLSDKEPTLVGTSKTGFMLGDELTCAVGTRSSFSYPGRHVSNQYFIKNSIEMLCVRPLANDFNLLHISYNDVDKNIVTAIFDVTTKKTYKITTDDGMPLYKGCYHEGCHYYAKQTGPGFEDRKIMKATRIVTTDISDSSYAVQVGDYMGRSLLDTNLSHADMLNLLPKELQ